MAEIVERLVKKYYEALDEGKVLGRKCPVCGNVEWPPVYACNACGCMDTEWIEMSQKGTIEACLLPTVMSTRPSYVGLEPFAYCVVKCEEGPERNVMVRNVTKENADYVKAHLPYPVHIEILQRNGFKTAVFAIDPILGDGTPDTKLAAKRAEEAAAWGAPAEAAAPAVEAAAPEAVEAENSTDPEIFNTLAQIVADAYKTNVEDITPDTPFEGQFKASSVVFVGIVAMIENEFDVFMSITDASKHKTVGRLAAAIEKLM